MIERLQPDANLLVRHEDCLVSKERQMRRRLVRRTPWKLRVVPKTTLPKTARRPGRPARQPKESMNAPKGPADMSRTAPERTRPCHATSPCLANTRRVLRLFSLPLPDSYPARVLHSNGAKPICASPELFFARHSRESGSPAL